MNNDRFYVSVIYIMTDCFVFEFGTNQDVSPPPEVQKAVQIPGNCQSAE